MDDDVGIHDKRRAIGGRGTAADAVVERPQRR